MKPKPGQKIGVVLKDKNANLREGIKEALKEGKTVCLKLSQPKHAYANEVMEVETALHCLSHIDNHRIPLLAGIALDKAYEALWSAKRAFDAFAYDER